MLMTIRRLLLAIAFLVGATAATNAADISWSAAFEIETDADVDVSKNIVRAVNVVSPDVGEVEVEFPGITVEFEPEHTFEFNPDLDEEFFSTGHVTGDGTFYSGQDEALTTDNLDLDRVLDSHGWAGGGPGGAIAVLELQDLEVGQAYQIQLIGAADDRDCCEYRQMEIWDDSGEPVPDMNGEELWFGRSNDFDQDDERGPGSVFGFFTADATEQRINLVGTADFDDGNDQFGNGNDPGLSAYILSLDDVLNGDYNGNGELDSGDLDLQSQGIKDGDLAFDINEDGLVNFGDREHWVKVEYGSWIGDANLDFEFNSGDLVAVFTAGKYDTGQMAVWTEGDWNGDMVFDSGDLVVAFQDGGFEQGPPQPAVPEPSSLVLTLIGLGLCLRLRSR